MTVRLQVSMAVTFAVLTALVLGLTAGLFFANNRDLAIATARDAMAGAQAHSAAALAAEVAPVVRVVATAARFAGEFPEEFGARRGFDMLAAEIAELNHVYSVFLAGAADGRFAQVARILPGMATFGADAVPDGAAMVYRTVAKGIDRVQFVATGGRVLRTVQRPSSFDPRQRTWFAAALVDEQAVVSPIYTFASTQRAGVTFSNRFAGRDGRGHGAGHAGRASGRHPG